MTRSWGNGSCRGLSVALAAASVLLGACASERCEKARLELSQEWENLRSTATSRQQIPMGLDLTAQERDERMRVWTSIEAKAELLRSSFGTPQVTWSPAQKARAELAEVFKPLAGRQDPMTQGFVTQLAVVDKKMADFNKTCR